MTFPRPEIPADLASLLSGAYDRMQAGMPRFRPATGGPDTFLFEAHAAIALEVITALQAYSAYSYARLGELDGLPLDDAMPATGTSTWTFVTSAVPGQLTIRQGTPLILTTPDGDALELVVTEDTLKPADTATLVVPVETVVAGSAANDASGDLALDETIPEVASVALNGLLANGVDQETEDSYLGRLTELRRLSTPRPVKADEFAIILLARPEVGRVTVRDLFNPVTNATNARATATCAVAGPDGGELLDETIAALQTWLRSLLEANFDAFVVDYDRSPIDVTFTGVASPDVDPDDVASRVAAAINAHLAAFATPSSIDFGLAQPAGSDDVDSVGYLDLAAATYAIGGLGHRTDLTIGLAGGVQGRVDLALPGDFPLPTAGDIDVTVTAP